MSLPQPLAKIRTVGQAALNLLLPPLCLTCDLPVAEQGDICAACWRNLRFITDPCCPICGMPYELSGVDLPCPACLTNPPLYQTARAAVIYDQYSRGLILGFKHADQTHIAASLARMMLRVGQKQLTDCAFFVPVPLHRWRLFRRKYNQAALLAQELSRMTGIAAVPDLLIRHRATAPQGRKSATQRTHNVRDAFMLNPRHGSIMTKAKHIMLLDDVLTTGATVNACTKTLLGHGAASVRILTFARTV